MADKVLHCIIGVKNGKPIDIRNDFEINGNIFKDKKLDNFSQNIYNCINDEKKRINNKRIR